MKKLLAFICLCIQIVPIMGQSVLRTSHGVKVETKAACVELECFSSSIIRVKKYPLGQAPEKQSLSVTMQPEKVKYKIQEANNQVILTTSELTVLLDIIQNQVRFATKDGKELLAEKPSYPFIHAYHLPTLHTYPSITEKVRRIGKYHIELETELL